MSPNFEEHRLIDKRTLLAVVPLSYSNIWDKMQRGEFPLSFKIGARVYWRWSEIEQWINELPRSMYRGLED